MISRIRTGNILRRIGFTLVVSMVLTPLSHELSRADERSMPDSVHAAGDRVERRAPRPEALGRALVSSGLENIRVVAAGESVHVAYENRRYRHSADALGVVRGNSASPFLAFERRLDMDVAAIEIDLADARRPFRVQYPSDRDFPPAPPGPGLASTSRSVDLLVGPLLTYEIGHIFDPFQLRVDIEPRVRYNPWPGALATLAVVIPLQNDFTPGDLDPDIDRVRPGPLKLDQFAFIPGMTLVSGSGGYFGNNRYGVSLGVARPIAGGRLLADAQFDETGFLAFPEGGTVYSNPDHWSGFAGLTWRPPLADLAVRARLARFLYGDQGGELELTRAMGDFEVGGFVTHSAGVNLYGVRLDVPVPPMKRATGSRVRLQPVERFPIDFRSTSEPAGTWLSGVASRTEFLRQLNEPGLRENLGRYRPIGSNPESKREPSGSQWISWSGMTGFITTPWAGVLHDRDLDVGYRYVPRRWAWDHRGTNANEVYYATLGFLPHLETAMRWTRIPGYHSFEELAPDSRLTDIDRMVSARLELLTPRPGCPGLAVGVEDAEGTRRFHSSYAVAGLPVEILQVQSRVTLGYGFRVFEASRYVLDGGFGAVELSAWRRLVGQFEYDSEKWNAALGLAPGLGFQLRAALLNLESLSIGIGWSHAL